MRPGLDTTANAPLCLNTTWVEGGIALRAIPSPGGLVGGLIAPRPAPRQRVVEKISAGQIGPAAKTADVVDDHPNPCS